MILVLSKTLKALREEKGLTPKEMAEYLQITRQAYNYYELGQRQPSYDTLRLLAKFYNVTTDYLLGQSKHKGFQDHYYNITDVDIRNFVKIPVVGVIRAGDPILAEANILGYEYTDKKDLNGDEYFYLKVTGDSMNNSRIEDGDLVLVRCQSDVDDGEIAVVIVNGNEATLKKVYRKNETLVLQPDSSNPIHQPQIYNKTNCLSSEIQIIGKVINAKIRF